METSNKAVLNIVYFLKENLNFCGSRSLQFFFFFLNLIFHFYQDL